VESSRPTPGLLMVWAGSDSSVERWRAISEGARHKVGVGTARVPAPSERVKVVQGVRGPARWTILMNEGWLWRERLPLNAGSRVGTGVAIFVRVIFGG
jgi:hypothetical protein